MSQEKQMMTIPKWKFDAFLYDEDCEPDIIKYGLTYEQVLGIAYYKSKYFDIHDTGLSWLCSIDGRHRSGKSVLAILLAIMLDKHFWEDRETRIVYTPKEIMDAFTKVAAQKRKGAVIIIDEAASAIAGGDWYEDTQKAILKVLNTFGYLRPVIFFLAPVKENVAGGVRRLFHTYIKVRRSSRVESVTAPYETEFNSLVGNSGRNMKKHPRINIFGQKVVLSRIHIKNPPKEIINWYKAFEKKRKNQLIADNEYVKKKVELKKVKEDFNKDKDLEYLVANEVKFRQEKFYTPQNPTYDYKLIKYELKRPKEYSQMLATMLRQKMKEQKG